MKKLLALVLALVMTLSLCVVSSNAAYKDAADVDYKEAVDVLTAVGVFVGDGSGNFYPDQNLTRAQAAKVISYLLLGQKVADGIQGSGTVFTDVAASHWAAGYIEYCASVGVLAGIGDGKFDPNGQLTGLAFAKMLLVALGYDATYEGYTGANWSINVAKKATDLELFDGNDDIVMSAVVTRQEAAQYAFNALQTQTVTAQKGTTMNVNGVTVVTSGEPAVPNTGDTNNYANGDNTEKAKLYLCEKLYGNKLILRTEPNAAGKSTNTWYYNAKGAATADKDYKVGAYVNETEAKVIVATKDAKTLAYWLESVNTKWEANNVTYNGAAGMNASDIQIGSEILVFTDDDNANTVTKVIVNQYSLADVGTVTKVSGKDYDYTVKIGARTYTSDNVPGFDADTYVRDAVLLVLYKGATTAELVSTKVADSVVGKLTKTNTSARTVEVDGVAYTYVDNSNLNYTDTFTFYLDNNGYVAGAEVKEATSEIDGYVYVKAVAAQGYQASSSLGLTDGKDAKVKLDVIYMDGTTAVEDLKVEKANAALSTSTKSAKTDADEFENGTIAKGDYYFTFAGVKYDMSKNVAHVNNTSVATVLQNGFYAYEKNDDGTLTLSVATNQSKGTAYTVTSNSSDNDTALVKDSLVIDGTYTANSSTKVVAIAYDSTAKTVTTTSYTGYKNFPALKATASQLKNLPALVCYTKGSTIADTVYVVNVGDGAVTPDVAVTYAYYVGSYATGTSTTYYQFYVDGALVEYKNVTGDLVKDTVYSITKSGDTVTASNVTNYKTIVTDTDEAFFVDSANNAQQYATSYKVWDLTDGIADGAVAEGKSLVYALDAGKVKVVYVVDDFVAAQSKTVAAVKAVIDDNDLEPMGDIVSLDLAQSVDNSTIYLSGVLTAMEDTDAQKAGMKAFNGGNASLDEKSEVVAYYKTGAGWANNSELAFVMVEVDGDCMIIVLGQDATDAGKVTNRLGHTSENYTIDGVTVTVDFTGLSF